jgi:hypothetical protein
MHGMIEGAAVRTTEFASRTTSYSEGDIEKGKLNSLKMM